MRKCTALLLLLAAIGCQPAHPQPDSTQSSVLTVKSGHRICHVVICWLKNPGDAQAKTRLIEASQSLRQIPGVVDLRCGTMLPSSRPVVDSSYDVAVVIEFDNVESLKAYQTHPVHLKLTHQVLIPATDRLTIYDFEEK